MGHYPRLHGITVWDSWSLILPLNYLTWTKEPLAYKMSEHLIAVPHIPSLICISIHGKQMDAVMLLHLHSSTSLPPPGVVHGGAIGPDKVTGGIVSVRSQPGQ